MQARMVIIPSDDGLNVVIWGRWAAGTMRARHFDNRTEMIETLMTLRLITPEDAPELECFTFVDSCPLFAAEVEEDHLEAHGFKIPYKEPGR